MIIKKRTKPLPLQKLEALVARLPANFPQRAKMEKDLSQRYKGYIGEQKVDYFLEQLPENFLHLHDVCLEIQGKKVQIDSLILTPHTIYLIESKNFEGTITFDTTLKQFIRDDASTETGFRYPITQAEITTYHLKYWLTSQGFPHLNIRFFIAISEPTSIIKVIGDTEAVAQYVAHAEYIPLKVMEMENEITSKGSEDRYRGTQHSDQELSGTIHSAWTRNKEKINTLNKNTTIPAGKIAALIKEKSMEFDLDIMRKYNIEARHLLPGVHCPNCRRLGMVRKKKRWHCNKCNHYSGYAHIKALHDYFMFVSPWITNKTGMKFLVIPNRHIVLRLFRSAKLIHDAKKRIWKES